MTPGAETNYVYLGITEYGFSNNLHEVEHVIKTLDGVQDCVALSLLRHDAIRAAAAEDERPQPTVVAGPLCESGDVFTQGANGGVETRPLPLAEVGDYLGLHDAGAYGLSTGSNYNSRPPPPDVFVDGGATGIIEVENRLGLGHASRRYGSYRVGVNVFHGEAASRILKECELRARVTASGAAAATIRGRSTRSTW